MKVNIGHPDSRMLENITFDLQCIYLACSEPRHQMSCLEYVSHTDDGPEMPAKLAERCNNVAFLTNYKRELQHKGAYRNTHDLVTLDILFVELAPNGGHCNRNFVGGVGRDVKGINKVFIC